LPTSAVKSGPGGGRDDGQVGRDVVQPGRQQPRGPEERPRLSRAELGIHGGGFRAGDCFGYDGLGVRLAQRGCVAVTVDYRLAPKYPFPVAVHDVKGYAGNPGQSSRVSCVINSSHAAFGPLPRQTRSPHRKA